MTGRRKVTDILAVTPQSSRPARDQAMTSSRIVHRIPPWMTPSQPSNRRSSSTSVQERSGSTWMVRPSPWALRVPQAKQLCGAISKRGMPGTSMTRGSDVKVLYLAGLGLDELLARRDLLAHEHREDLVRVSGFIVVSHSWSAFISPRPLKRCTERFLTLNSLMIRSRSFSDCA